MSAPFCMALVTQYNCTGVSNRCDTRCKINALAVDIQFVFVD